jgi:hypothetical protein
MRQVREVLRLMTAATTFNRRFRSEAGAPGPSHRNGERMKNRCVLGGTLDPLTPNSMRQGDTGCGSVRAGGGGWASSPIEGGGY